MCNFKCYLGECTVFTIYVFQSLSPYDCYPQHTLLCAKYPTFSKTRETKGFPRIIHKTFYQKPCLTADPDLYLSQSVGQAGEESWPAMMLLPWVGICTMGTMVMCIMNSTSDLLQGPVRPVVQGHCPVYFFFSTYTDSR